MRIDIKPEKVFVTSIIISLIITILHFALHWWKPLGMPTSIFYADEQVTLSGFFSVVLCSFIAIIFFLVANQTKDGTKRLITGIVSLFFLGLAFDEYVELHGFINDSISYIAGSDSTIDTLGNISWILTLSFLILISFLGLLAYAWIQKDMNVRRPFLIGMLIFLLVLIVEIIGGQTFGKEIYIIFVGVEEALEMIGQSFFLLASLKALESISALK